MSPWLLLIPIVAALVITWVMGQPLWCSCGSFSLWYGHPRVLRDVAKTSRWGWLRLLGARPGEHYSQHLFDPWTVTHVAHGMMFYGAVRGFATTYPVTLSLLIVLSMEAVWEIIENTPWVINAYRSSGDIHYKGDSVGNVCGDLVACLAGALFVALFV